MVSMSDGEYNGMGCKWLENGSIRLAVTTSQGPKIIFWGRSDGVNLFAEVPDGKVDTPAGTYHFVGGHRLWYAPERIETTYWPDNDEVEVVEIEGGARFSSPPDGTGIAKETAITLSPDGPEVRVHHTLRNTGDLVVRLAPWAISMCRPGGIALMPQPTEQVDPGGFLPNRRIALWTYSDVNDPRIALGNKVALVRAQPGPNNKIGFRNVHGWLGYLLDGTLITKHFDPQLAGIHPDDGCNAEFFFSDNVIELETLAPLVDLGPGGEVAHEEVWCLYDAPSGVENEEDALALIVSLGL